MHVMIFRVSFLVVATVVAIALSQKKQKCSSIKQKDLEKDESSLQQLEKEEEKFTGNLLEDEEATTIKTEVSNQNNRLKNFDKNDALLNLVKEYEQRKVTLQRKLLQLYGLKEQQSHVTQLRRNLEKKIAEMSTLTVTINLLRVETNDLQKEIEESVLAQKQLEKVQKMIDKLQAKMGADADAVTGQLMMLQERVSWLQTDEISCRDMAIEEKLIAVEDLELEVYELWRKNKELELEKRDLAVKAVAAQDRISALSSLTQSKRISNDQELSILRNENEDLSKQVERLQSNRFDMVEELVYQRWLNACLQFETQTYHIQSTKPTKQRGGTNSSQTFHQKTKQSMSDSEHNLDSVSCCTSSTTDIDNNDSSTNESSSSSQRSSTKKAILFFDIKKWRSSIDNYFSNVPSPEKSSRGNPASKNGLIRRFSTSMVPSKPSMLSHSANNTPIDKKKVQESTRSPGTPSFPRARRVSFNDSITTVASTFQDMPRSVRGVLHNKEGRTENSSHSPDTNSGPYTGAELARVKQELSSLEMISGTAANEDTAETKLDDRFEIAKPEELQMQHSRSSTVLSTENKVEIHIFHLIAVCFILLAYFLLLAAGIY